MARWARQLDAVHARLAPHFARPEPRARARAYLQTVLAGAGRRNGWQLAEAAGEGTPYGMQRLVASAAWDADAVRDALRAYVLEHLGGPGGVLVVDETGFLKKGDQSAGVQRQYSGTAGRIENCQVGVFLAYAGPRGHAFVDRALYLPREWCDDRARCRAAGVPDAVGFRTKPALARALLERALDAGVRAAWVTADEVYGSDHRLRLALEERDQPYVLAVRRTEALFHLGVRGSAQPRAAAIADALPRRAWRVLSAGAGTKGLARLALSRLLAPPEVLRWSRWRRRHQWRAQVAHYRRHGASSDVQL